MKCVCSVCVVWDVCLQFVCLWYSCVCDLCVVWDVYVQCVWGYGSMGVGCVCSDVCELCVCVVWGVLQ